MKGLRDLHLPIYGKSFQLIVKSEDYRGVVAYWTRVVPRRMSGRLIQGRFGAVARLPISQHFTIARQDLDGCIVAAQPCEGGDGTRERRRHRARRGIRRRRLKARDPGASARHVAVEAGAVRITKFQFEFTAWRGRDVRDAGAVHLRARKTGSKRRQAVVEPRGPVRRRNAGLGGSAGAAGRGASVDLDTRVHGMRIITAGTGGECQPNAPVRRAHRKYS